MDSKTFDVQQVAVEWYHNDFPAERMPDFAVWALQNGRDGPALRELAGLTSVTKSNDAKLIEKAFSELDVQPMSHDEAAAYLVLSTCKQIVAKQIPPYTGASRIAYCLFQSRNDSKNYFLWAGLVSEWEDVPAKRKHFEDQMVFAAWDLIGKASVARLVETIDFRNGSTYLHAVAAGPKDGPVVVLLHGFPEFWYGWHRQIEPLAAAGFRVIVPDQRGYNLSSKPQGVASYALNELVSDIIAIADQLGQEKISLAGHDWGAAVAWSVALLHPERIAKLAVLNVPHPSVMRRYVYTRLQQMLRSWYIFFFQIPLLPEAFLSALNFRAATRALHGSSCPGTFSTEDLEQYRAAWSQPGALTAMINWYRAAIRHRIPFRDRTVRVPTRILWGERDRFLMTEMAHESLRYCANGELFTFAEASHWLQHEEPEKVSRHLVEFFVRKQ